MSQGDSLTIEEALSLLTTKKQNFTHFYNNTGKITQFATSNPTTENAAEVQLVKACLTKAYGELMDACDNIIQIDPTRQDDMEEIKEATHDKQEGMVKRALATLQEISKPSSTVAAPVTGAHGGHPRVNTAKLADNLKPGVITADNNPVEFKAWA